MWCPSSSQEREDAMDRKSSQGSFVRCGMVDTELLESKTAPSTIFNQLVSSASGMTCCRYPPPRQNHRHLAFIKNDIHLHRSSTPCCIIRHVPPLPYLSAYHCLLMGWRVDCNSLLRSWRWCRRRGRGRTWRRWRCGIWH